MNSIEERRFWSKVDKSDEDGCWVWTAAKNAHGYGLFRWQEKSSLATRVLWEHTFGPISDGLYVCHHCDNPSCVRLDHLYMGTQLSNIGDCVARGRISKGEHRPASKLTEENVREIRKLYASGMSKHKLAAQFGVVRKTILDCLSRKNWKGVE